MHEIKSQTLWGRGHCLGINNYVHNNKWICLEFVHWNMIKTVHRLIDETSHMEHDTIIFQNYFLPFNCHCIVSWKLFCTQAEKVFNVHSNDVTEWMIFIVFRICSPNHSNNAEKSENVGFRYLWNDYRKFSKYHHNPYLTGSNTWDWIKE